MQYKQWYDENGLPGCIRPDGTYDGGDTAAILGNLIALGELQFADKLASIWHVSAKVPRRHPDPTEWWGQPDRFSRDQLIPIICTAIAYPGLSICKKVLQAHKQRWFIRAWNTRRNGFIHSEAKAADVTGPEVWALWIRAYGPFWLRPLLPILDLELLLSAVHWRLWRKDRVTRNHMLSSIFCYTCKPTLVSRLAFKLNNWQDLVQRWYDHCEAVNECPTAHLFVKKLFQLKVFTVNGDL